MRTSKYMLALPIGMLMLLPGYAQRKDAKSEKQRRTERMVNDTVRSGRYKISVNYMIPLRGNSRSLTSNYSVEIRNDSVFSYLPYVGVAYRLPYGGGKGLIFDAPLTNYRMDVTPKGMFKVSFDTRTDEDTFTYRLTIWNNGSASIDIQPINRESISFAGDVDLKP